MNSLHKAVKGGRPLAVVLLLKFLKSSSPSNNNNNSLRRTVLKSVDSQGRTPLQLAKECQNEGEEEILSLRRWDVVAGGTSANFNDCVSLLEAEEEEQAKVEQQQQQVSSLCRAEKKNTSLCLSVTDNESNTVWKPFINSSNGMGGVSGNASSSFFVCGCEFDGSNECQTALWENAFRNKLKQSTTADLYSAITTCSKVIQSQTSSKPMETNNESESISTSIIPGKKITNTKEETIVKEEQLPLKKTEKTKNFGRQCFLCEKHSLTFFNIGGGKLVCRKCKQGMNKRRNNLRPQLLL